MTATVATHFVVPPQLSAGAPPEARGLARDEVRLMVASSRPIEHTRFDELPRHLHRGDVLVVNTSATVAAALTGTRPDGRSVAVHVSSPLADGTWLVELRCDDGSCRIHDARLGELIAVPGGHVRLRRAYPDAQRRRGSRLWRASFDVEGPVERHLEQHARPITYGYVDGRWPLRDYQTVFARHPGSAEMPSAGRPFSEQVLIDLMAAGVDIVPILLHTGVSSLEAGEVPLPERYAVSADSARRINQARAAGGRVVAVGTTVTRAVETTADETGQVSPGHGWTDLVIGPDRPVRVVGGLVTGWHEPEASHLLLLEAVAGPALVQQAYDAAVERGYLWHEFGDSALLLADRPRDPRPTDVERVSAGRGR